MSRVNVASPVGPDCAATAPDAARMPNAVSPATMPAVRAVSEPPLLIALIESSSAEAGRRASAAFIPPAGAASADFRLPAASQSVPQNPA